MLSPIAFLIEHRKAIVQQYRQHDSKPKKTWASLQKILPQLSECMRFNTFKRNRSVPPEIFLPRDWGGSDTFSTKGYRLSNILPGILIPQPACFNDA